MKTKFILLINGENSCGEEFNTYEDAMNEYYESLEGMSAGYDILNLMGDVNDREKTDPQTVEYVIVELDENGIELNRTYLD